MDTPDDACQSPTACQRLVILISGRGSNMAAIVEAARADRWPAVVAGVVAHRDDLPGVVRARQLGLPVRIVPLPAGVERAEQDRVLSACIEELAADWIVLAGYMRILSTAFVRRHAGRLINIHPSLLPAFAGLHTHRRALAAGVKVHGATVHLVTPELDNGPILAQAVVPVLPDDDEATLAERVLRVEHRLYPLALRALFEGRITVVGCRTRCVDGVSLADPLLLLEAA